MVSVDFRFAPAGGSAYPTTQVEVTRTTATTRSPIDVGLVDRLANVDAARLDARVWTTATQHWRVVDPGHLDRAAGDLQGLDRLLHHLLVGDPTSAAAQALGFNDAAALLAGELAAAAAALPGDRPLSRAAYVIRVTGVVVGVASGHPVLMIACVKPLLRQTVTNVIATGIKDLMGPGAAIARSGPPPPTRPRPPEPNRRLGSDGMRPGGRPRPPDPPDPPGPRGAAGPPGPAPPPAPGGSHAPRPRRPGP